MADTGVITVPREEYEALIARNEEADDRSPDPPPAEQSSKAENAMGFDPVPALKCRPCA